ncbi:MAG: FeoB small GTPase domain-containing protein [Pyrinomonadaceae bacterium]
MVSRAETIPANNCGGCASNCNTAHLTKLGIKSGNFDYVVALAGNPNTGKSTIFNSLTGLNQHVGNWAGKTVTRAEGAFSINDKRFKLVDLPGTYSLLSTSVDEEIARDFILFGKPHVTIIVTDATCLERNLGLTLQILEITDRAVIALNLIDEARRSNLKIDERILAKDLDVPVVPMAARRGEGIKELLQAVETVAGGSFPTRSRRIHYGDAKLETAVETLAARLRETFDDLPNARWVALRLIEGDESIIRAVREKTLGTLKDLKHSDFPNQLVQLEAR